MESAQSVIFSIITGTNNTMSQSELEANPSYRRQTRENNDDRVMIGVGITSY